MDPEPSPDLPILQHQLLHLLSQDPAGLHFLRQRHDPQILDLACGSCEEALILTRLCSLLRNEGAHPNLDSVTLTGLDLRAREISQAADRFRSHQDPATGVATQFEFLHGDATRLARHQLLPEQYDLIFMRHQNYWNGYATWEKIFHQALEKLAPGGRLIITSYFDREHDLALQALARQGANLILSHRNPDSRELSYPGKSIDRHLALLQRQP